jgi:hypothetical protein
VPYLSLTLVSLTRGRPLRDSSFTVGKYSWSEEVVCASTRIHAVDQQKKKE